MDACTHLGGKAASAVAVSTLQAIPQPQQPHRLISKCACALQHSQTMCGVREAHWHSFMHRNHTGGGGQDSGMAASDLQVQAHL